MAFSSFTPSGGTPVELTAKPVSQTQAHKVTDGGAG
jgi:hypothetical protein